MSVTAIVLIIIGAAVFILGYILPVKKTKEINIETRVGEEYIKGLVEQEVDTAKKNIGDIVEETITYAMEKTERAMERLSNEKIMAVNEYSDTVLETINKNHTEVIFLYDMLNDKHTNLVNTVGEASKIEKDIKQRTEETVRKEEAVSTAKQKEEAVSTAKQKEEEEELVINNINAEKPVDLGKTAFMLLKARKAKPIEEPDTSRQNEKAKNRKTAKSKSMPEVTYETESEEGNNNEKILTLHKQGKSKTAIAKELGLGVGEVKLVIDLFEQT